LDEPCVRVLVVDDFDEWRQYVCETLNDVTGVVIVGEASDGIEALQKTQELRPDLVILDLGLPRLNGFEVARQIRAISPQSEIIFLTESHSADIREEAFRAGAINFVIKSNAASELVAAVRAALKKKSS
jgi:DNA-binding NarL/FixJ family response regulator